MAQLLVHTLSTGPDFDDYANVVEAWRVNYDYSDSEYGFAMVRNVSPVPAPAPAVIWLFGTGLVGLIGVKWRKKPA